jgi:hypothetical protein
LKRVLKDNWIKCVPNIVNNKSVHIYSVAQLTTSKYLYFHTYNPHLTLNSTFQCLEIMSVLEVQALSSARKPAISTDVLVVKLYISRHMSGQQNIKLRHVVKWTVRRHKKNLLLCLIQH